MKAREKFSLGDRVRMNALGRRSFPGSGHRIATVMGYGQMASVVRVLFDGNRTPESYSIIFWERVDGEAAEKYSTSS
jgi:hypothetical protein